MTSSRPRGVISRLSSSGGTETSNVAPRCPTVQSAYDSCTRLPHEVFVYTDPYIGHSLSRHARVGLPGTELGRHRRQLVGFVSISTSAERCAAGTRGGKGARKR